MNEYQHRLTESGALEKHPMWVFFEEICAIPHGSGNEGALADYVETFAKDRGLYVYRDKQDDGVGANNVFIRLPASEGQEDAPAVLLQGHLDMVCEKESHICHDFEKDGLDLFVEDGKIGARGTTLGGDDGIAVAMMLAMLDDPPKSHPAIECLFTVCEETGLEGAYAFDPVAAGVTATTLINLDSECEGVVTAGCAGGMRTDITLPVSCVPFTGTAVEVCVDGFSGGHSGVEIHEGHKNAVKVLGELLLYAFETEICPCALTLCEISGGGKDNAIPRSAKAVLAVDTKDEAVTRELCRAIETYAEGLRARPDVISADKAFTCTCACACARLSADATATPAYMFCQGTDEVLSLLTLARDGVLSMSADVSGMVAYSRNLGILRTLFDKNEKQSSPVAVQVSFSTRSACEGHLDSAQRELSRLAKTCHKNANVVHYARYPGWDFSAVSPLREKWLSLYQETFGRPCRVEVIHAGLECGILRSRMPWLDVISVGPDILNIHTPKERLDVASSQRVYQILKKMIS